MIILIKGDKMDGELIYALVGIIIFLVVGFKIMQSNPSAVINTKDEKRDDILREYKKQLYEALTPLKDDRDAQINKKSLLLKKFSEELSANIYFDQIEVREIILDLAEDY